MNEKALTNQTGQARGDLRRIERDMGRVRRELHDATRNRMIGGVLLVVGALALLMFFTGGGQFVAIIAGASLLVGGLMFVRSLLKIGRARRTMNTMTDGVAKAQAKLSELEAQPSIGE